MPTTYDRPWRDLAVGDVSAPSAARSSGGLRGGLIGGQRHVAGASSASRSHSLHVTCCALIEGLAVVGELAAADLGALPGSTFATSRDPPATAGPTRPGRNRRAPARPRPARRSAMPPAATTGVARPAARTAARIAAARCEVAAERAALVGVDGGHALVALSPGVRIAAWPTFGCLASSNLPPLDTDRKSRPARAKLDPEPWPRPRACCRPRPPRRRGSGSRPRRPAGARRARTAPITSQRQAHARLARRRRSRRRAFERERNDAIV
jgi:hypothetical protein